MKRKYPQTVRTTISIPGALKQRMDQVTDDVNWSALASQAFQDKLVEIAARKKEKDMADVIERLRASKRKSDTQEYQEGYAAGKRWAEESAEAAELERLSDLKNTCECEPSSGWDGFFEENPSQACTTAEGLYFTLHPEHDGERDYAQEFWSRKVWKGVVDEHYLDKGEYLKGFADGAIDTWDSVKDKL